MRRTPAKVTIYDVAERAGVSISTVSLAVNSPHRVRAATRQRIMVAAADLGYRMGGAPRAGATRIAVAAPYSTYPSYLRRLSGMLQGTRSSAVDIVPFDLDSAAGAASPLLETLPARADVSGIIVMGVPLGGAARRASRAARIPIGYVDVVPPSGAPPAVVVLVDDRQGGRLLGAHLADRGHHRVAFVHEVQRSPQYLSAGMMRVEGLSERLELVPVASDTPERVDAARLAHALSPAGGGATAVVANHDLLGAAVITALGMIPDGRRVPVVGYDDGDVAQALDLTTVRQPFEESGRIAITAMLAAVTDAGRAPVHEVLAPQLIIRGSSQRDTQHPLCPPG